MRVAINDSDPAALIASHEAVRATIFLTARHRIAVILTRWFVTATTTGTLSTIMWKLLQLQPYIRQCTTTMPNNYFYWRRQWPKKNFTVSWGQTLITQWRSWTCENLNFIQICNWNQKHWTRWTQLLPFFFFVITFF